MYYYTQVNISYEIKKTTCQNKKKSRHSTIFWYHAGIIFLLFTPCRLICVVIANLPAGCLRLLPRLFAAVFCLAWRRQLYWGQPWRLIIEEAGKWVFVDIQMFTAEGLVLLRIFLLNFPADGSISIGCNILIIIVLQNDFRFLVLIGLTRWSKTATIIGSKVASYLITIHYIMCAFT